MAENKYSCRIIWSEEDNGFIGLCTELSGLSWLAKDQAEALREIVALVNDCIADMEQSREEIPEPISMFHAGAAMTPIPASGF